MIWYSGYNNYKKHELLLDYHGPNIHRFKTELTESSYRNLSNIHDVFYEELAQRQTKYVEVLYSGGMDSETVIRSCMISKIPVRALTAKFMINGYPINTHDLYHSERFCRLNDIEQVFVELDVKKFFENGDHVSYIKPYHIWQSHIATHFWIFEQATGFPVFGGEYSWPWVDKPIISPHKLIFMCYDRFLSDRGIHGIGSMLGNSLDSNMLFIKHHIETMKQEHIVIDNSNITTFKQRLFKNMGFGDLEPRMKYYGWDNLDRDILDIHYYTDKLIEDYGFSHAEIKWNRMIANILGGEPGTNDKH